MIFTRRDFSMVMIMIAVLLLGLTYLLGDPMIRRWREASSARATLERDRGMAARVLKNRPEYEEKLVNLRATLPTYGINEAVGATLLLKVRQLAQENGFNTKNIVPEAEKQIGNLYELPVDVSWEAELEPLVRFLYAVQIAGATLDIRTMSISPAQDNVLKGNLKIFFAYKRGETEPAAGIETTPVEEMMNTTP